MWDDMLCGKGFRNDAGWALRAVENYVPFYNPPAPEKQAALNAALDTALDEVCEKIRKREKSELKGSLLGKFARYVIHPLWASHVNPSDKNWQVSEKCTGCGICAKVCPVGNIVLSAEKRPTWNHACEQCMACFHWCPEHAISWGTKSVNYRRYHHPSVKVAELFSHDQ